MNRKVFGNSTVISSILYLAERSTKRGLKFKLGEFPVVCPSVSATVTVKINDTTVYQCSVV